MTSELCSDDEKELGMEDWREAPHWLRARPLQMRRDKWLSVVGEGGLRWDQRMGGFADNGREL